MDRPATEEYFIDGAGRVTSSLQLLSSAAAATPTVALVAAADDDNAAGYPKTIVASDNEISNGFVSDGKRLPYVFEANESGKEKDLKFKNFHEIQLRPFFRNS